MQQQLKTDKSMAKSDFEQAYQKMILDNKFFEKDLYYLQQKPRYFKTIKYISGISLPEDPRILEIGGGQIALLMKELYKYNCTVADVNENYKEGLLNHGINFISCDLLHDNLSERNYFDLVIMCEVIEHMPIPPYIVLEKINLDYSPNAKTLIMK
jgi:2-polyprenyl-3-methyl-5-hydroxy-6-metoxy-1,4-benzoquinol methylase